MPLLALLLALHPSPLPCAFGCAQEEPDFVSLFDGSSLSGWTTRGGHYDGNAAWRVEEGCIVGRQGPEGEGGLLYTEDLYTSFELRLETKLDTPFDSGVFVRMVPEGKGAQVTLDWREGGEIGAIYSDGFLQHNELGATRFRRDEWNDLRVRCSGFDMRLEVWLNGEKIADFELPPDSPGYAPSGRIGLQVHGERGDSGAARFRAIRVQRLPLFGEEVFTEKAAGGLEPTPFGRRLGWRALFDGRSLEGWEASEARDDAPEPYRAEGGILSFLARGAGGQLATREDFGDFFLRLDFRPSHMANSGVFLRAARDGSNPAFSGCELQILDDFEWERVTGTKLAPWQFTGSLYGSVPAGPAALRPIGAWNTYEILFRKQRLAVALNGHTLYDVDTHALVPASGAPFAQRATTGFIGLQNHASGNGTDEVMVAFRNVLVCPL